MDQKPRMPTIYLSHGAGPCFFVDRLPGFPERFWDNLRAYLQSIPSRIGRKPRAVVVISAHWECLKPTLHFAEQYQLLYDYYGFPADAYSLKYSASGEPEVAANLQALLERAGIECGVEHSRGLDHGVFVPLKLIYPEADVPVVQISLVKSLDAKVHLAMGRAIESIRDEDVLIVGSGSSYHNLSSFFSQHPLANKRAEQFDDWLEKVVRDPEEFRNEQLLRWSQAPGAVECHPRSEHLMPLLVVAGAAGADVGRNVYREKLFGKVLSAFHFGNA